MADLIKKIKIKKQDGTFTDYIPIGAEASNVETSDGESVQLKLNKKPYYYDTVADMKADTKLKVGDMAITLGYYEANDGGAAEYYIVNDNTLIDDGGSVHDLINGLKAKLLVNTIINANCFKEVQDAIEYAYSHNIYTVILNKDTIITKPIELYDNMVLDGQNHSIYGDLYDSQKCRLITNKYSMVRNLHDQVYYFSDDYTEEQQEVYVNGNHNITIKNISSITGRIYGQLDIKPRGMIAFDHVNNLNIINVNGVGQVETFIWCTRINDLVIDKCNFENTYPVTHGFGGCIWIYSNYFTEESFKNITIRNCILKSYRDENIAINTWGHHDLSNILIENCTLYEARGQSISLNGKEDWTIHKVKIVNNNFIAGGISLDYNVDDIEIVDNTFNGNFQELVDDMAIRAFITVVYHANTTTKIKNLKIKRNSFNTNNDKAPDNYRKIILNHIENFEIENNNFYENFSDGISLISIPAFPSDTVGCILNNNFFLKTNSSCIAIEVNSTNNAKLLKIENNNFNNVFTCVSFWGGFGKTLFNNNKITNATNAIKYNGQGYFRNDSYIQNNISIDTEYLIYFDSTFNPVSMSIPILVTNNNLINSELYLNSTTKNINQLISSYFNIKYDNTSSKWIEI